MAPLATVNMARITWRISFQEVIEVVQGDDMDVALDLEVANDSELDSLVSVVDDEHSGSDVVDNGVARNASFGDGDAGTEN